MNAPAVGLVGLGTMGTALALRLLETGAQVIATSRGAASREALAAAAASAGLDEGLELVPSAGEVVAGERVGVLLLSLPSGAEVMQVCVGLDLAGRRVVVVDTSTTAPEDAVAVAGLLAERGIGFLDAPVSGGPGAARSGTLSVMVGGRAADLDAARPVLDRLAARLVSCGDVGAGQTVKACNQLVVTANIVSVAEALLLARAHGVDAAIVREALLGGYAASRVLEVHGESMLRRDWRPGGRARLHAKDMGIVRALAHGRVVTPAFSAAAAWLDELARRDGELDPAAVLTLLEAEHPLDRGSAGAAA